MFGRSSPNCSVTSAPEWANTIVQHHLPGWDLIWHNVKSRNHGGPYGCCWPVRKTIEIFIPDGSEVLGRERIVLHEIAHGLRGDIPKPAGRKNDVHHDEKFFRIAALLYIGSDQSLKVLEYAMKHEYRTGRHVMEAAHNNPKQFIADPIGYRVDIFRKKRTRRVFPKVAASHKTGDYVTWLSSKRQCSLTGRVLSLGYRKYRIEVDHHGKWDGVYLVPFSMVHTENKTDPAPIFFAVTA